MSSTRKTREHARPAFNLPGAVAATAAADVTAAEAVLPTPEAAEVAEAAMAAIEAAEAATEAAEAVAAEAVEAVEAVEAAGGGGSSLADGAIDIARLPRQGLIRPNTSCFPAPRSCMRGLARA